MQIGNIQKGLIYFFVTITLISCGGSGDESKAVEIKKDSLVVNDGNCETYYQDAKKMDEILMKETSVKKDLAAKSINAFNLYASHCKNDSLAPIFLLKAGQVAQSVGDFKQAEILLNECNTAFPKFRNRGAVLFILAQLYDDVAMINNEDKAKAIYEEIIQSYPNSPWARDAKICIDNLGKTDEELVQEFLIKVK